MRDDFCAFILTHGRPDKVLTYRTLRRAGYTGKIFIVVDDEDKTRHQYMAEFGEQVLVFSKADIASRFDEADNFCDRRSIFYARNACFDLAKLVGCKYFIQLDDDYHEFQFRVDRNYDQAYFPIRKLDAILSEMLAYYESIPALSIAMSQGGDFLGDNGGHASWVKRKAMNSFICSVERPFSFMGRINEDVNTYTNLGRCGELFMTIGAVQLGQKQTQKNSGGMTELYLDSGMRGWTIKGKPASDRAVLSQEQDGIKSHTHSASVSSTDLGTKTTSSFDYGTKSTNNTGAHTHSVSGTAASAGAHTHSMTFVSGGSSGAPGSGSPDYSKYSVNTSSAGAHTHSVSGTAASAGAHAHTVGIGAHTHSVAIGSHGHTITVNAAGNAENTVKNIAFNYIVRLA